VICGVQADPANVHTHTHRDRVISISTAPYYIVGVDDNDDDADDDDRGIRKVGEGGTGVLDSPNGCTTVRK